MKKGFTLIEVLAVIAVLAIIMIIAAPKVLDAIENAKINAFESNAKLILKGINTKIVENQDFDPTIIDETTINSILGIADTNYQTVSVSMVGDTPSIEIIGKNNWADLKATGTLSTLTVGYIVPAKIYGVEFDPALSMTGTRTDDAIGLGYTVNASTIDSDFDTEEIFGEIVEESDVYGNKFMKIPKFYIKKTKVGTVWTYQISKQAQDASYYLPACFNQGGSEQDYVLIGKYEASLNVDKLESKSGVNPLGSKNITSFRTYAQNNGAGYGIIDIHTVDVIQTLFYIEFATIDSKSIMKGYADSTLSAKTITGATDSVLSSSGSPVSNTDGVHTMKYRGIENFWGNINSFIDGINMNDGQPYVSTNFSNYQSDVFDGDYSPINYVVAESGFIEDMGYDENHPYLQLASTTGTNNYNERIANTITSGLKVMMHGGYYWNSEYIGIAYWTSAYGTSNSNAIVGSRLMKLAS